MQIKGNSMKGRRVLMRPTESAQRVPHLIKYAQFFATFFAADNRWSDYASDSVYIPDNHWLIAIRLVLLNKLHLQFVGESHALVHVPRAVR